MEDGIAYGDVIEGVDFNYAARLTAVNAVVLAGLAWAPPSLLPSVSAVRYVPRRPCNGTRSMILLLSVTDSGGAIPPPPMDPFPIGACRKTQFTLEGMVIDNFLFGVSAVGSSGNESVVVFPSGRLRR